MEKSARESARQKLRVQQMGTAFLFWGSRHCRETGHVGILAVDEIRSQRRRNGIAQGAAERSPMEKDKRMFRGREPYYESAERRPSEG